MRQRLSRVIRVLAGGVVLLLAGVSIMIATLAVRSYWEAYGWFCTHDIAGRQHHTWAYVSNGGIWVGRMALGARRPEPRWAFRRFSPSPVEYEQRLLPVLDLGFGYTPPNSRNTAMYGVAAPLWFVALVLGVVPGWWLMRILRRRRRGAGSCCRQCGYDLRATPLRCPECGMEV